MSLIQVSSETCGADSRKSYVLRDGEIEKTMSPRGQAARCLEHRHCTGTEAALRGGSGSGKTTFLNWSPAS